MEFFRMAWQYRDQLSDASPPQWERKPLPLYLLSEKIEDPSVVNRVNELKATYKNPVFLKGVSVDRELYDRSWIESEVYRNKRDQRMTYELTQQQGARSSGEWHFTSLAIIPQRPIMFLMFGLGQIFTENSRIWDKQPCRGNANRTIAALPGI